MLVKYLNYYFVVLFIILIIIVNYYLAEVTHMFEVNATEILPLVFQILVIPIPDLQWSRAGLIIMKFK